MPEPAARGVVSDDGSTIWLTAYTAAGEAVPVALQPARAVALAGELIEAAVPKLNVTEKSSVACPVKTRGGDPYSDQRRTRDAKIRTLAPLVAPGKSIEQQARDIAGRLARYRPMPDEASPERRLMQEIVEVGLPVGADRIRKILGEQ